jgi:hypothetical protein
MQDWIKLNTDALNVEHEKNINGVTVMARLSPHDVPIAARASSLGDSILIELRYLDDEPWNEVMQSNGILCRIGRHSGRLFGIRMPREFVGSQARFRVDIESAVKPAIGEIPRRDIVEQNFRISTAAIAETKEALLPQLSTG